MSATATSGREKATPVTSQRGAYLTDSWKLFEVRAHRPDERLLADCGLNTDDDHAEKWVALENVLDLEVVRPSPPAPTLAEFPR